MAAVFGFDLPTLIEKDLTRAQDSLKERHRRDSAIYGWRPRFELRRASVGDDRDIGVYHASPHSAAFIRLSLASSASAASVKASPMKRSGQFRILPKRSSSRGVSTEDPCGALQK